MWLAAFLVVDTVTAVLAKASQGLSFSSTGPWLKMVVSILFIFNLISYPEEVEGIIVSVIDSSVGIVQAFSGNHD